MPLPPSGDALARSAPHTIVRARSTTAYAAAADLIRAYADELAIDLCFQDFEAELQALDVSYGPPDGSLLLGMRAGRAVGCVGLRAAGGAATCEMKRLYVTPAHRGDGLGAALCQALLDEGRRLGYAHMVLDTLRSLTPAVALYRRLGFAEVPAYYDNPLDDVLYMGRPL